MSLLRESPRGAGKSGIPSDLNGPHCIVTITLDQFRAFCHEAIRLCQDLPIDTRRGNSRPIDLVRLMAASGGANSRSPLWELNLYAHDAALRLPLRYLHLRGVSDLSFSSVWIFSSGLVLSGPRRPRDIAGWLGITSDRIRHVLPADLDRCLDELRARRDREAVPQGAIAPDTELQAGINP